MLLLPLFVDVARLVRRGGGGSVGGQVTDFIVTVLKVRLDAADAVNNSLLFLELLFVGGSMVAWTLEGGLVRCDWGGTLSSGQVRLSEVFHQLLALQACV